MILEGRVIKYGKVEGEAIVSEAPIGFLGGVDPDTGMFIEKGHPLEGKNIKGKILVFPTGKGSTVGSYTIYRMKKKGVAPLAIINEECEPIVAVGAIISEIPCIDRIDIRQIKDGSKLIVDGGKIILDSSK